MESFELFSKTLDQLLIIEKQAEKEDWVYGKGEAGGIREAR